MGRAIGSVIHSITNVIGGGTAILTNTSESGINVSDTTLDTCVQGGCVAGSGGIDLRGQGIDSLINGGTSLLGGNGLGIYGSTLRAGGDIVLDGIGGTLAAGVSLDLIPSEDGASTLERINSVGNVIIRGIAGDESANNTIGTLYEQSGVILGRVSVSASGNVTIAGQGGTRNTLTGEFASSSHGVEVGAVNVAAGTGQTVSISGQAGSPGYGPYDAATPAALPVYGVLFEDPSSHLAAADGHIDVLGLAGSDVVVNGSLDAGAGNTTVNGNNILLDSGSALLASSNTAGGNIEVNALGVLAQSSSGIVRANAGDQGNGGAIHLYGTQGLRVYGSLFAQGGNTGGNGGSIETSGGGVDLRGIRVDASASHGNAGTWLIDPYDVAITSGTATGSLTGNNPFAPLNNSTIQDGDINAVLNASTNVTITTGAAGTSDGNITIGGGVNIQRSVGAAPVTFRLDANAGILGNGSFTMQSTAGALNLVFDADANGVAPYQGINLSGAQLLTNGGDLVMFGQNDPNGFATATFNGINLNLSRLDTRVGQSDTGAGGRVSLRGKGGYYDGFTGVSLSDTSISSSTGAIDIVGEGQNGGSGIALYANTFGSAAIISTTSGAMSLTGLGSTGSVNDGGFGLRAVHYALQTDSGTIDLRGYGTADRVNDGLVLDSLSSVTSNSGNIFLSGTSAGGGSGVSLVNTLANPSDALAAATVSSNSGIVVIRAHNNGSTDALRLDGSIASGASVDLRPGGVDINGNVTENPNDAIALGGNLGFAISSAELANIATTNLVLGSDIQVGRITVSGSIGYDHNLTLDAGAGGGIAVNGALDLGGNTLALISAGDITQRAPITAKSLLVISGSGLVNLDNAGNNVSSATLAGSASGNFTFVNAGTVGIGNVSAIGFAAAPNAPLTLTASGVHGNDVLVRALTGNMLLEANVSGTNVDLVSAGIFDNPGGNSISATGIWHVWGNSWIGETRGGLAGSGTLPNLYGCAFGATCSVTPSDAASQFIYIAQPTATINVADATREYGLPNGSFGFTVGGLILGDQAANAINGTILTGANQASNVGSYAINGSFVSPAGYLINVVPGLLAITPATLTYIADPYTRVYGDPNGALAGSVSGLRLADTLASST
ncbi:MAG: MBG domain-containing protein, partial [Granulicella sp.]